VTALDPRPIRAALLSWYAECRRDLPWRRTSDPYAILVSEMMLQQTQVARVAIYWPRFLARFPTVRALARASEGDVLVLWSGLGYYRRARMLHRAAKAVVGELSGRIPRNALELARLPGVGAYTAAAVASIAFGEPVPVLDANVIRVLSRLAGVRGDVSRGAVRSRLASHARRLLDPSRPGDWNQAMMELGALVCTAFNPRCERCPIARSCRARRSGDPARYPRASRPAAGVAVREAVAIVKRGGKVLLVQGGHERGWWEGLWMLPRVGLGPRAGAPRALEGLLSRRSGLVASFREEPAKHSYTVTKHRVTALVCRADDVSGRLSSASGGRWFAPRELARVAIPAPDRRMLSTFPRRTRR
jgi:A/G-specific adenine glycosylase